MPVVVAAVDVPGVVAAVEVLAVVVASAPPPVADA